MRSALVTVVIGEAYERFYDRHIREGHERLARAWCVPLHVIRRPLYTPSDVDHPHASWEKVKILEEPELAAYEALCWIDADIFVRGTPPNPFELAGDGWLAVDDDMLGVPAQAELARRWWYGFAPESAWPRTVINTGLFVVHRDHTKLLRSVWDLYGGRWDQGPVSFHLVREPGGVLGPAVLNRLVIHHLATRGYGPSPMRAMVEPGVLLHFAAASAMRTPDYLAWAEHAEAGGPIPLDLRARAAARALRFALERPARAALESALAAHPNLTRRLAKTLDQRIPRLGPALASVAEWQEHVLDEALRAQRKLLVSRSQEGFPGWVTVDPVTPMLSGTSNRKFGASAPAILTHLDTLRAVVTRPPGSLDRIVVLDSIEALPHADRVRFVDACRRACGGTIDLIIAAKEVDAALDQPFATTLAMRHAMARADIERLLADAEVDAQIASTSSERTSFRAFDTAMRLPRGHWHVRFTGLRSPAHGPVDFVRRSS